MMRGARKQGPAISWLATISSTPRHRMASSLRLKTRLLLRLSQSPKTRLFLRLSQRLKTRLFLRLCQSPKTRLFLRLSQRLKTRLFLMLSQRLKTRLFLRLGRWSLRHRSALGLKGGQCSKLRYVDFLILRCLKFYQRKTLSKERHFCRISFEFIKLIFE
jgi:hypothetical protein